MGNYIIKVTATEACNPDFAPEKPLRIGQKADGYVIIGFTNRKPSFETMAGVSVHDLSEWLFSQGRGAQKIRAACAIAEGRLKAGEILAEDEDVQQEPELKTKGITITWDQIRRMLDRESED